MGQKWPLGQAFPSMPSVGRGVVEPVIENSTDQTGVIDQVESMDLYNCVPDLV